MDIELIKHLANQYQEGRRDAEALMAIACLEAYEQGFEDGANDAQERMHRTQLLLMFTAGNA